MVQSDSTWRILHINRSHQPWLVSLYCQWVQVSLSIKATPWHPICDVLIHMVPTFQQDILNRKSLNYLQCFYNVRNEVANGVMFFTEGLSVHRGEVSLSACWDTTTRTRPPWEQCTPPPMQTVHILLECILSCSRIGYGVRIPAFTVPFLSFVSVFVWIVNFSRTRIDFSLFKYH